MVRNASHARYAYVAMPPPARTQHYAYVCVTSLTREATILLKLDCLVDVVEKRVYVCVRWASERQGALNS
eukprot:8846066-Pyramimonas_sp.AAC.1